MSKKLIAGFISAFIITAFILSFYLEPLHAFVESILVVSLLSIVYYMLHDLIVAIIGYKGSKDSEDYTL